MADKPFIISKDLQVGDGSAAGTTDALLRVDDTNNRVGINTPTPTGTLDVTVSSSGDRGLIVRSVSSQTTKSFEILGANGSGVFSIDPSGSVYFAPWSGTQTSSIKYDASSNGLVFTGSGTSANPIELNVLSDSTLSFEGTAGQLFSVADGLSSGTIFAVSDISGMPSLEIDASGLIKLGEFDGFVGVGTSQTYGQYSGKMEINYPSGYKGLIVRPGSAEIRNALDVQNASSGTVFSVDPYGATVIDLTTSTTSKGLIIQAAASQSVNLQEWQNSSSTVLASVNQEGRFSGVSYNASSGVILQAATPASTTNTLYNVGGSLYFNGSAVGGSISTLTFGSGLSGSTSSTFDGTSAVTVNLGGTGTLTRLNFSGDTYIYTTNSIYIGYEAGKDTVDGFTNVGIGYSAMGNDGTQAPSGYNNIGIGWSAGNGQRGDGNVYIGSAAGLYNEGSNNLEIIQGTDYNKTIIGNYNGPFSNKLNLGSVIVGDTSSKRLAIGNVSSSNLSPNSTIEILPSGASTKSLILKGTVSYATNFLEVQNSSSTANLYIDQNYNLVTTGNVVANSGAFNVLDLTPIPDTNYPAYQEGLVFYDDENKSLTVYNDEADISLQLGQETYLRVRNDSGSGILNGQLVYISGSQGTHPQVGLAIANCVYKSQAVGMATHDIEDNSFGYVTTYGIVRGLDTSGYGSGLPVYLSPTVSGGYTLTAPEPPYFNVHIGHIIRGDSASNGSILIEMESPKFAGLDVTTISGNINISGIPFYSVSGCAGVAMVTDPSFYYDSGNNKLVVPTGQVTEIRSSDTNVRFLGSGTTALPSTLTRSVIAGYNNQPSPRLATDSVYLGSYAGSYASGQGNVGIGIYANAGSTFGGSSGSGNYNTYIGYYAGATNNGSNNLVLNIGSNPPLHFGLATSYSDKIEIAKTIVGDSSTRRLAIGNVSSSNFSPNAVLEVLPSTTTTKGVIVKGYAGQAVNLLEIQNSSSTRLNTVDSAGKVGIITQTPTGTLDITAVTNSTKGLIVRSATNQSANLVEVLTSSGTNLFSISNNGAIYQSFNRGLGNFVIGDANTFSNTGGGTGEYNIAFGNQALQYGYNNASYTVAIGHQAQFGGGTHNVAIGHQASYASDITASYYGVAIGATSRIYHASTGNVAIGYNAVVQSNSHYNVVVGYQAGEGYGYNPTNNCVFIGYRVFRYFGLNTSRAIAIGSEAALVGGGAQIDITDSVIVGASAGQTTRSGIRNSYIGNYSGRNIHDGSGNVGLGYDAGTATTYIASTGCFNTSIGYSAKRLANVSNSITIGANALATQSGQLVIGSSTNKVGTSDGTGEQSVSSATPSGVSKLLQATINGSTYQIPLLPSGATDLYIPPTLSGGASGYIPIWDSASSLTYDSSLAYSTSGKYFTYTGTGVSANPMKMKILDDSTLSFESTDGQLFSISDGLQSGRIFAVNDISGMPFIEVDASGLVKIAEYDGVVGIGTSQTYGQYSGKVEITYPSGLGGLISRPASGAPGNALEVQTFSSGTVFTVSQSGTISSTLQGQTAKGLVVKAGTSQTANLIELQDSAGTPVLTISPSGSISGAIAPGIITTSSSPYSLTDAHHGKIVEYTGTSSGTFNIGTITVPGWNCMLVNLESGILVGANGNTLYSPDNMSGTRTKYSSLSLYYRGSNTFVLAGDLA